MIYVRLAGGLGNQLFQLVAALHLQGKAKMSISFFTNHLRDYETPRDFYLNEILPTSFSLSFARPNIFVQFFLKYRINKAFPKLFKWSITNKNIETFKSCKFYVLDDYFQDISMFQNEMKIVSEYISSSADKNEKIKNIFQSINNENQSIAIHIRRGDFLSKTNSKIFFTQEDNYYKKAILTFTHVQKVVIFSETKLKDLKNITNLPIEFVSNYNLTDVEEFMLMSKFSNIVIANSTYSFWASVVSKGSNDNTQIIAPENWVYNSQQNIMWMNNLDILKFKTV